MQEIQPTRITPRRSDLDSLAAVRTESAPVFSLYLNGGSPDTMLTRLNTFIQQPQHQNKLEHASAEYRRQWLDEVQDIRAWLAKSPGDGAQAVAIFSSQENGIRHIVHLPRSVAERLIVDTRPYLRPIEVMLRESPCTLVALAGSDTARLVEICLDQIITDESFPLSSPPGSDSGLSDSDLAVITDRVRQRCVDRSCASIIVGAAEPIREQLAAALSASALALRTGYPSWNPDSTASDLLAQVREIELEHEQAAEMQRVQAVIDALEQGGLAVAGLEQTLLAVRGKKARLVLVESDFQVEGGVCPNCGFLGEGVEGVCLFCEMALRPEVDIIEAALKQTLDAGYEIDVLRSRAARDLFKPFGRIGALIIDEGSKPPVKDSGLHTTLAEDGTINTEALRDEAIEESFPASDPPGW